MGIQKSAFNVERDGAGRRIIIHTKYELRPGGNKWLSFNTFGEDAASTGMQISHLVANGILSIPGVIGWPDDPTGTCVHIDRYSVAFGYGASFDGTSIAEQAIQVILTTLREAGVDVTDTSTDGQLVGFWWEKLRPVFTTPLS